MQLCDRRSNIKTGSTSTFYPGGETESGSERAGRGVLRWVFKGHIRTGEGH